MRTTSKDQATASYRRRLIRRAGGNAPALVAPLFALDCDALHLRLHVRQFGDLHCQDAVLEAAVTLSISMPSSGMRRSNWPYVRSLNRRSLSSVSVFSSPFITRTP